MPGHRQQKSQYETLYAGQRGTVSERLHLRRIEMNHRTLESAIAAAVLNSYGVFVNRLLRTDSPSRIRFLCENGQ